MTRFSPSTRAALVAAMFAATAVLGCATQNPEQTAAALDTAAIRSSLDSLQTAFSRSNRQGVRSYVTEDALLTGPGGAAWDSLQAAVRDGSAGPPTVQINGRETRILSDRWAYKLVTATVSLSRAEGDTIQADRTSLLLFHRTEDGWKIHRVLNSSNRPRPLGTEPSEPDTTADGTPIAESQRAGRLRQAR